MPSARLYRAASPFNDVELAELDYEQTYDVMYLAHIDHAPGKLERYDHADWRFLDLTFGPVIGPPADVAATATTPNVDADNDGNAYFPQPARYVVTAVNLDSGQESRASAEDSATNDLTLKRNFTTVTWSAADAADKYRVYKAENTGGFGWLGDTVSLSFVDDNITADLTDAPPVGYNPFEGEGNYPSTVTFFQQRLTYGRTRLKPNGVWMSQTADFDNFDKSSPLKADDSVVAALDATKVNAVNQLVSLSTGLLALGSDGVFQISGADRIITPTQVETLRSSGIGASRLNPILVDTVAFFQTNVGNEVHSIGYEFEVDGVDTSDVTIFSTHFFEGHDIKWWAFARFPRSIIWAGRSDGKLLAFTWEKKQQVFGWTLCETDGFIEAGTVITEPSGFGVNGQQLYEDRLYVVVQREIDGEMRKYNERMAEARWIDVADTCFLDSALRYNFEEPQTILRGLDHLEGRAVAALADGQVITNTLTVEGGSVELPFAASRVSIGLPFVGEVETLPLAPDRQFGDTSGKRQQAKEARIRVERTRGLLAGVDETALYAVQERSVDDSYDQAVGLFSGICDVTMAGDVKRETTMLVRQTEPLPFTLLAAYLEPIVTGG